MPFFIAPPPSAGEENSGSKSRPYMRMYVGAIGMGFTTADLKTMPLDRLMWLIHCNNLNNGAKEPEEKYQKGTVAQLKKLI